MLIALFAVVSDGSIADAVAREYKSPTKHPVGLARPFRKISCINSTTPHWRAGDVCQVAITLSDTRG